MQDKHRRLTDLLQEMKTAQSREQADDVLLRALSLLTTNSTYQTIRRIKQAYQRAVDGADRQTTQVAEYERMDKEELASITQDR